MKIEDAWMIPAAWAEHHLKPEQRMAVLRGVKVVGLDKLTVIRVALAGVRLQADDTMISF